MSKKTYFKLSAACAMTMLVSANVNAASCFDDPIGYCLTDGNASFSIDSFGLMEMTVDNITHIYTTDFIVDNQSLVVDKGKDAGLSLPGYSFFDYMDLTQTPTTDPYSVLDLNNLNTLAWASIDLSFELQGGTAGSNQATIIETFTITNTSGADLPLSMIAYTDVDLGGSLQGNAVNDQGALQTFDGNGQPTSFKQWDAEYQMLASVDIAPDRYEVGLGSECDPNNPDLCYRVYNGRDTLLANSIAPGPGDLQMAAQWTRNLAAGESFSYTQTMVLGDPPQVPVPAAVWLFGSGLIGLVGVARRRKA